MMPKFTSCLYLHLAPLPWLYPLSYSPIPTFFFHPCTCLFPTRLFYHPPSHLGPPAQQDPLVPPSSPGAGGCHPSTVGVRPLARSPQSCMWHQHQCHLHPKCPLSSVTQSSIAVLVAHFEEGIFLRFLHSLSHTLRQESDLVM